MYKKSIILSVIFLIILVVLYFGYWQTNQKKSKTNPTTAIVTQVPNPAEQNPLSIVTMRKKLYPGSNFVIEQTLGPGSNYQRYIASYLSDGLKIYGLLTVPDDNAPKNGWPAIIFNHGYIPPEQYHTTERYIAYTDAFSRSGYILFKPDYRGNGSSEGTPEGAYYSPAYATDVLNALASVKKYSGVNPQKIGMWGHSMGGNITLRDLVVDPKDIKAAVIWSGVVGSYNDLMNNWQRKVTYQPSPRELSLRNASRSNLVQKYGTPQRNPDFWNAIDPTYFLSDITAPIQLHQGLNDEEVPPQFMESLAKKLQDLGKKVELFTYPGADHNISDPSFSIAINRSVEFFDKYLK